MILQYCSKTMLGGHENIFLSTKSINSHLIFLDVKWKYLASNSNWCSLGTNSCCLYMYCDICVDTVFELELINKSYQ